MYKVLLVDDDKTVRYMLKRFKNWEHYGFCIAGEACDGKEAFKRLAADTFDVIITDIRMQGMNGIEFLQELRARKIDICLILLSTYTDFEYAQQGIRLGVFDYMTKPVDDDILSDMLARVGKHLDEKRQASLRMEEEKRLLAESLALCYPEKGEKRLLALLLAGDRELLQEADSVFGEVCKAFGQADVLKIKLVLEKLLVNSRDEIYRQFPWLAKIGELVFPEADGQKQTIDAVREAFLEKLGEMLAVIRKYELHHTDGIIKKTCEYVLTHVEKDITLENIAAEVHVTKSYLGKLFKQRIGYNFTDYVTKVKMEHAKCLLRTGEYKNYEVSEKLGYSSIDYFCRLFKQYSGMTPLEFRKQGL
ncbi:response regulator transcription factor [Sporomusa acidovorans]|uniref:Regulator of RpoS n=1 Tax=Sporomusa acidovorans (strain ATCC 49682 / DSM 3132 / Mol) TaxID=1123286 RepID=A0ABZ3J9N2_SPOA4|nr:response regulator [Sporomusa acidovorans]OZC16240.1 putative response regulatory protein [Sporomusa acidovorans DSM 3132]SDE32391.1 two component transcriptional regulator, AraC family [Sporomusa acidovorans]